MKNISIDCHELYPFYYINKDSSCNNTEVDKSVLDRWEKCISEFAKVQNEMHKEYLKKKTKDEISELKYKIKLAEEKKIEEVGELKKEIKKEELKSNDISDVAYYDWLVVE